MRHDILKKSGSSRPESGGGGYESAKKNDIYPRIDIHVRKNKFKRLTFAASNFDCP